MNSNDNPDRSELAPGERHPAAESAMEYVKFALLGHKIHSIKAALSTTAIEGNRLSEVCLGTIRRLENGEPVGDRYLFGLAWVLFGFCEYTNL